MFLNKLCDVCQCVKLNIFSFAYLSYLNLVATTTTQYKSKTLQNKTTSNKNKQKIKYDTKAFWKQLWTHPNLIFFNLLFNLLHGIWPAFLWSMVFPDMTKLEESFLPKAVVWNIE